MLIDVNCYLGHWPFVSGLLETVNEVAASLTSNGVTEAYVASLHAAWVPDPAQEERKLRDAIAGHEIFRWAPIIRPDLPNWRSALGEAADGGAKLVKLLPAFHQYKVDNTAVVEFITAATELNLRVAIVQRLEDSRRQHPLCQVPGVDMVRLKHLVDRVAPTPLLVLNAMYAEFQQLADRTNAHFDLAFYEYDAPVPRAIEAVGGDRVMFGTCAPLLYAKAQKMKLDDSVETEAMRNAVAYENFQKFIS